MKEATAYPIDSWQASREGALKKIRNAAKDSGNEVLEEIAKEDDPAAKLERMKNAEVIDRIVSKCVSNYRNGEYSYKKTVDMICDALKKVK